MSEIFIRDLVAYGNYGVSDEERNKKQPICASIYLTVDTTQAESSDDVSSTANWSDIKKQVITIIETNSFKLMERLSSEIATSIMKDDRIQSIRLTLEKPTAFSSGVPGITKSTFRH